MDTDNQTQQGRNSAMDKTDKEREAGVPMANQGGGKIASGNANSGHPANDIIGTSLDTDLANLARHVASANVASGEVKPGEQGTKGSGMPVVSGAGQMLDDRPGRDDPKGSQP